MLKLFSPGTKVLLDKDIQAVVITVSIHSHNYVQYECAWWSGATRTREWFGEHEIIGEEQDKGLKIGFGGS